MAVLRPDQRGTPADAGANPFEAKLDLIIREMAKTPKTLNPSSSDQASRGLPRSARDTVDEARERISAVLRQYGFNEVRTKLIENGRGEGLTIEVFLLDLEPVPSEAQADISEVFREEMPPYLRVRLVENT